MVTATTEAPPVEVPQPTAIKIEYEFHPKDLNASGLFSCEHCGSLYFWQKSSSTLKSQFDSFLCEKAALGFAIEALIKADLKRKSEESPA